MHAARGLQLHVREYIPLERRLLGLVGGVVSNVVDPILEGSTTTNTQNQPTYTTTTSYTTTSDDAQLPEPTTTPSPAANTASPANNDGVSTTSPNSGSGPDAGNSGTDNGNNGNGGIGTGDGTGTGTGNGNTDSSVSSPGTGTSTALGSHTDSASQPLGSSVGNGGNKGGTSGGTLGGDASNGSTGSDSGSDTKSNTTGGSLGSGTSSSSESGSSKGGSTQSTSGSGTLVNGHSGSSPGGVKSLGESKGNNSHGGAIAAAAILIVLLGIVIVIFILRRRSRARRHDQANKWWFTRNHASQSYEDTEALHAGISSRRSSFATTVDQSTNPFCFETPLIPPPPPPTAEVGRSSGTAPALVLDLNTDQNRLSTGSAGSHSSQFLVVVHRESLLHEATATARTESFTFPKPPVADRASLYSKTSLRSRSEPKQDLDDICIRSSSSISLPIIPTRPADPFADNNPFADPASLSPSPVLSQNFAGTVRRPFFPQREDELQVNIGDFVRLLQSFDDGWALAEKVGASNGKQGFIPLECFHEMNLSY